MDREAENLSRLRLEKKDRHMSDFVCETPEALSEIAVKDTNRIVGTVAKSLAANSPYINIIRGGTFPSGVSDEIRSVVQMPAAPGDSLALPEFLCDTDMCGTLGDQDLVDTISYLLRLESKRGQGPKVCVKKGYAAFKGSYATSEDALRKLIVQYINADIRAQLYVRGGSKFVAANGYTFSSLFTGGTETDLGVKFQQVLPTGPMTFKALQYLARHMREEMFADWFSADKGMPHYRVIAEADQIEYFRNESGVLQNMSFLTTGGYKMGETALTAYSFESSPAYRGLAFGVDQRPLRATGFNEDGTLALVNPVTIVANPARGTAYAKTNSAWRTAPYGVGTLIADSSFERLVPERYVGEGSFRFAPQLVMGELDWHYVIDNRCNQYGDYGWHKYQITRAYKPIRPHWIVNFLYQRPQADLGLVTLEEDSLSSISGGNQYAPLDVCEGTDFV
jgi:hypothetical protein